MKVAHRFIGGIHAEQYLFSRPLHGLSLTWHAHPALKRWAIFIQSASRTTGETTFAAKPVSAIRISKWIKQTALVVRDRLIHPLTEMVLIQAEAWPPQSGHRCGKTAAFQRARPRRYYQYPKGVRQAQTRIFRSKCLVIRYRVQIC